ncbi:MAG: hypothetical protein RSF81_08515 [Oscillospiraceae bacterium]
MNDASFLINLLKENDDMKKVNAYNQSIINIYNKWFDTLGVDITSIKNSGIGIKMLQEGWVNYKTYRFPEITMSSLIDDELFMAIDAIKNKTLQCNVCDNGTKHLELQGETIHYCYKCGRLLA